MLLLKKITTAIFCLFAVVIFSTSAFAATYDVTVNISGLENLDLSSFDFDVEYDSDLLSVAGYTLTTELGSIEDFDAEDVSFGDDEMGTLSLGVFSYLLDLSSQSDAFDLATITFSWSDETDESAAMEAIAALSLSYLELGDEYGDLIACTTDGTNITVTSAVPIPSALTLMGFGLMGLLGLTRNSRD